METGQTQLVDLHEFEREIVFGTVTPRVENGRVIGAAYFQRSARADLYSILAQWPDSTLAGEALLAERTEDGIRFLSPLVYRPNIPLLSLVLPKGDNKILAEQGLNSQTGLVQGTDYAENQVLGAVYRIPGTPWVLVAKALKTDAMGIADVISLVSALAAIVLLAIFSLSEQALDIASKVLPPLAIACCLVWPVSFAFPNVLRAAGDAKYTMIVSASTMWIVRFGLSWLLVKQFHFGLEGVWYCMMIDWVVLDTLPEAKKGRAAR